MITHLPFSTGSDDMYVELTPDTGGSSIRAVVSLKAAGDMTFVPGNPGPQRTGFFNLLGIRPERVVSLRQIHSRLVHRVDRDSGFLPEEGDGLVTNDPSVVLAVTVADCLPVFLMSRDGNHFGLVHSGWKGTGIAADAVRLLEESCGIPGPSITALLGPCIGPCCYDVPGERADTFIDLYGAGSVERRDGRYFLDLRAANIALLEAAGITDFITTDVCTCCTPRFGSFRREGPDRFTRMIALIGKF